MTKEEKYQRDYLKYYRIVRYYTKIHYNITGNELDLILYLFSERHFKRETIVRYGGVLDYRENLKSLLEKGLISLYAKRQNGDHWYSTTIKSDTIVNFVYNVCSGTPIRVSYTTRKLSALKVTAQEKRYMDLINEMNAYIKEKKKNPDKNIPGIEL